MAPVSTVDHQDLRRAQPLRPFPLIRPVLPLPGFITEAIYRCPDLWQVYRLKAASQYHMYMLRPRKCPVIGIFFQIVMVARAEHDLRLIKP